jgi:predicted outer membrane repeat protein
VTLRGSLRLRDGNASGDLANPNGGAVFVATGGHLVLDFVSLGNNRAQNGGAIYCAGTLEASATALGDNNTAIDDGGAMVVAPGAIATLDRVNIGRNTAGRGGSPVIDAGGPCTGTDQAGNARPQGGACDVGAREALPFASAGVGLNSPSAGIVFGPGETLTVNFNFLPGTTAVPRDLYAGAAVPTGSGYTIVSVVPNPGAGVQVVAGPTLVPLATNSTLTQPLTIDVTHTWAPSNPGGLYFVGTITTPPGANPLTPAPAVSLDINSLVFDPTGQ